MSIDEQHIALPKLYGAPAYARPALVVATSRRPFDPDDLPIEAEQSDDDREIAAEMPARAWAPDGNTKDRTDAAGGNGHAGKLPGLLPRPFTLRKIAGRLLGDD